MLRGRRGARSTVSVDLSATYCEWTARNLRLNGFEPGDSHQIWREDCLAYLEQARESGSRFDLVVCDPPTFSNSKSTERDFIVGRDQGVVFAACNAVLRPGGVLFFSTNDRRFRLDEAAAARFDVEDLTEATIPEDFRNRRIHRCWRMRVG